VVPFETKVAISQIEAELGGPLNEFFSSISEEPVAAASLAQVYKATLLSTGEEVAVKVQRPAVLSQVSKDLYVLRRAAEVYQGLIDRFAPQQRTDYVALLNEFAVGFYTELDFMNEGRNQEKMRNLLIEQKVKGMMVPKFYPELSTRRILVSEWVNGVKLSTCPPEEVKTLTSIAQEAFLVQLLEVGLFHADPHPGNILKLNEPGPNGEKVRSDEAALALKTPRSLTSVQDAPAPQPPQYSSSIILTLFAIRFAHRSLPS
jgi:predicted unusual protein kinase regulating ubiquinone biosynthesis (AarF/ABC1/UbiB family)